MVQAGVSRPWIIPVFAVAVILAGGFIGLMLHHFLPRQKTDLGAVRTGVVADCFPAGTKNTDPNADGCRKRGCIWRKPRESGSPWCVFPEDKKKGYGYVLVGNVNSTNNGFAAFLERVKTPSVHGNEIERLRVTAEFQTDARMRIKFEDADGQQYQIPEEAVNIDPKFNASDNALYSVNHTEVPHFSIQVRRKDTGTLVFDTGVAGFIFSKQFIQITNKLPSDNVYGFGEHNHRQLRHNMTWKTWSIFTRDVAPVDEWNLYGAQTLYMNIENDSLANAVYLHNSNAMEVNLQPLPYPAVTYRVIGGVLDFYIFFGPTPENIVQQFTEAVGRPAMPPYWSLGFQLSKYDYDNLTYAKAVIDRNAKAGIPQDVQYFDIDYMYNQMDFTINPDKYAGLPNFTKTLKNMGKRTVIILDHCIGSNSTTFPNGIYPPFTDGREMGIFIKNASGNGLLRGNVWPGESVYPDFTNGRNVTDWWHKHCQDFFTKRGVDYDGLWIDMNEPSNFIPGSIYGCADNEWNNPPFIPKILGADKNNRLYDKTICMDVRQEWGRHYDVHNLYGHSMAITTWNTLRRMFPSKRPFVLTRSQFAGSSKYAGHWLGDNQSQWRQMPWSIIGMLEYSLFGFPLTGSDICGFWFSATEEMCQRWMQLGAFYPYSRNHNAKGFRDQDPAAFSPEMQRVSRDVLMTRYKLLPYLYTLFYYAHTEGSTVARPLFHEFTSDKNTWSVDKQFLWGPAFMVSPAMQEGQRNVSAYIPKARWYDYYTGNEVKETGKPVTLDTPLHKINLHVRGGYVLPWQQPANSTYYSRVNSMGLLVALDAAQRASGSLFWDDGETFETSENGVYLLLDFNAMPGRLDISVTHGNYTMDKELHFEEIDMFGLEREPTRVTVDNVDLPLSKVFYDSNSKMRLFALIWPAITAILVINVNAVLSPEEELEQLFEIDTSARQKRSINDGLINQYLGQARKDLTNKLRNEGRNNKTNHSAPCPYLCGQFYGYISLADETVVFYLKKTSHRS